MGALVSLPITAGATFISSFLGSCCSSALTSTFQAVSGARSSIATRIFYAIGLTINALVSWIAMSSNLSLFWPDRTCTEAGECGFFTVNRLNFAQGLFHILLACLLVQVRSTKDARASLQNGFWFAKLFVYLGLVFLSTYIPNGFFIVFSKWVSIPGGTLFILIGLVLLVDFAHEWAETCVQHVEMEDEYSTFWKKLLIFGTLSMYLAAFIMDIVMLVAFCKGGCDMNIAAAVVNFVFTLVVSIASIHPLVQEFNPKCGLAQSSMVAAYCTYLTLSAMASAPDDKQCNPLVRSNGTRKMSVVLGSIFTFIAIAYTTTRAAANSAFQGDSGKAPYLEGDDFIAYDGITSSRSQLRREAVAQAVQEGSLPESALYANPWQQGGDDDLSSNGDDEKHATKYSYSLFHLIFFLATQWITILLTTNVKQDDLGDFIPVGRTYFYSWVKIVSAWICYSLYFWTLVAPLVLRDRFGYDF